MLHGNPIKTRFISVFFKARSEKLVSKIILEVNGSFDEVFRYIKRVFGSSVFSPQNSIHDIIQEYSDNLRLTRWITDPKNAFVSPREFILMEYFDIIREDNFAAVCFNSIERGDLPVFKNAVRGDAFGGFIIRSTGLNKCNVVYVFHEESKGMATHVPKSVLKKMIMKDCIAVANALKSKFL